MVPTNLTCVSGSAHDDCPICRGPTESVGTVYGKFSQRDYHLRRCRSCHFAFVADPWTDYDVIYTESYYECTGADPLVNYRDELLNKSSIRRYEWQGIHKWASALTQVDSSTRWLDYGCGAGGLVDYLRSNGIAGTFGFERSSHIPVIAGQEIPVLTPSELALQYATFDVVTAIEVIEHVVDPVAELKELHKLLRPGGLLLITTGNSAPYRRHLATWRYVIPEIHVSFFEPMTLEIAMELAGFTPDFPGYTDGWTDIIRYKILKTLGRRTSSAVEELVPWPLVSRLVDRRFALSRQPVGRAQDLTPA